MIRYLSLAEYVWLAEQVTGIEAAVLAKAARIDWSPDPPDVDGAEEAMLAVAAHQVDESWFANWLRQRVQVP